MKKISSTTILILWLCIHACVCCVDLGLLLPPSLMTVSFISGTGVLSNRVASARLRPVMSSSSTAITRSPGYNRPSR